MFLTYGVMAELLQVHSLLSWFLIYQSSDHPGASCTQPLFFFVSEKYDIWLLVALGWQLVGMNWSPEGYKISF
jgi:hypothetical protein